MVSHQSFKQWLFVEVESDAKNFRINMYGNMLLYSSESHDAPFPEGTHLPSGSYTIIGKGSELTEEQWKEIFKDSPLNNICEEDGGGYVIESGFKEFAQVYMKWKKLNPSTTLILLNNDKITEK